MPVTLLVFSFFFSFFGPVSSEHGQPAAAHLFRLTGLPNPAAFIRPECSEAAGGPPDQSIFADFHSAQLMPQ